MKKKIILDTNSLLAIYQFKIDIFSELDRIIDSKHDLYVVDKTLDELNKIAERKDKAAMAAKLALVIVEAKDIKTIKTTEEKDTDSLILKTAKKGFIVITQDKELKKRLKEESISVITLRKKQHLVFE